jgi:hypothetical protein
MEDRKPLSDDRAFALARGTMLTGALCGVIAAGFAWINGLRWYWIVVIAVAVYLLAALIQVVGIGLLARKRKDSVK